MKLRFYRKSDGLLYQPVSQTLSLVYKLIFRKIHLNNVDTIPANTPVILASNHPTAFIDPIFFCIHFPPPVYNMTRGDVFENPFLKWLFFQFNMFPVYRKRDGYAQADRNDGVFEYCKKSLGEQKTVNIFVEGEHHLDKRVLTLQKGFARIAFGTYGELRPDDLQIIPVGCAYHHGACMRDEARVNVGKPIFVKDYYAEYEIKPALAINRLCSDVLKAIKELCYHVNDKNDDQFADQLLLLNNSEQQDSIFPIVLKNNKKFEQEKALIDRLNQLEESEKAALKIQYNTYLDALSKAGLKDKALVRNEFVSFSRTFLLGIGLIPYVLSWVLTIPVRFLVGYLSHKLVKKREFYTSAVLGLTFIIGMIYCLSGFIIGLALKQYLICILFTLLPFITPLIIAYENTAIDWLDGWKAKFYSERQQLLASRPTWHKL